MKILFEEYCDILLTIIGGLIILSIVINSIITTNININHSELASSLKPELEKISKFECKDVLSINGIYDLKKDVIALSNSNIDLKDKVYSRIIEDEKNNKYVEYILKYNNDFRIIRTRFIIMEDENENDV